MSTFEQNYQINQVSKLYKAFLVRCWTDGASSEWRASAQAVQSGEIVRFASLAELFNFLEAQTTQNTSQAQPYLRKRTECQ